MQNNRSPRAKGGNEHAQSSGTRFHCQGGPHRRLARQFRDGAVDGTVGAFRRAGVSIAAAEVPGRFCLAIPEAAAAQKGSGPAGTKLRACGGTWGREFSGRRKPMAESPGNQEKMAAARGPNARSSPAFAAVFLQGQHIADFRGSSRVSNTRARRPRRAIPGLPVWNRGDRHCWQAAAPAPGGAKNPRRREMNMGAVQCQSLRDRPRSAFLASARPRFVILVLGGDALARSSTAGAPSARQNSEKRPNAAGTRRGIPFAPGRNAATRRAQSEPAGAGSTCPPSARLVGAGRGGCAIPRQSGPSMDTKVRFHHPW